MSARIFLQHLVQPSPNVFLPNCFTTVHWYRTSYSQEKTKQTYMAQYNRFMSRFLSARHPFPFSVPGWVCWWWIVRCRESVCWVWSAVSSAVGGAYPPSMYETVRENRRGDVWWSLHDYQHLRRNCGPQGMCAEMLKSNDALCPLNIF